MTLFLRTTPPMNQVMNLVGLTAIVTISTGTTVLAKPVIYAETGGQESLILDPNGLAVLETIGLTLNSANSTTTPKPGYNIGALLLPPSTDPGVRGTTFTFLYDDQDGFYLPLSGAEEFLGTLVFDVNNNLLPGLRSQFVFGNFSNSFDQTFSFFLTDTTSISLPPMFRVLDVVAPGFPDVDLNTQTWVEEDIDLLISEELSNFVLNAGASQSVAGIKLAKARADRNFVAVTTVPEPNMVIALITTIFAAFSLKKLK